MDMFVYDLKHPPARRRDFEVAHIFVAEIMKTYMCFLDGEGLFLRYNNKFWVGHSLTSLNAQPSEKMGSKVAKLHLQCMSKVKVRKNRCFMAANSLAFPVPLKTKIENSLIWGQIEFHFQHLTEGPIIVPSLTFSNKVKNRFNS